MQKSIFRFILLLNIQVLWSALSLAQNVIRCGTEQYLQSQEEKFPGTIRKLKELQQTAHRWAADHPGATRSSFVIPVVVHVIWHSNAENISESKILSQIDVLNEDFNRQNADTSKTPDVWKSVGGNISITFCLAAHAPDGSDTNGITRTYTDKTSFETDESMKHNSTGGEDGWPSDYYLNVWVCNLENNNGGNHVLGFAFVDPGGANDGVVISYNVFGRGESLKQPYDKGRTCTHEVGHWLSLDHTFSGGCYSADGCDDTPPEFQEVYGCHSFPLLDGCSINYPGVMFMNYMDYTDDECMNLFTLCQCGDIIGMLYASRPLLMTSPAGCVPLKYNLDASISTVQWPDDTLPGQGFWPTVQLSNHGIDDINFVQINYRVDGQFDSIYKYEGILHSQNSILVTLHAYFTGEDGHMFYAWTSQPNHSADQFIFNDTSSEEFFVRSTVPKNTPVIVVVQESPTDNPEVKIQNPSAANMYLQIVNMLGQIILQGNWSVINNPSFTLDLSNVPNGVYFIYGKIGYDYVKEKLMVLRN
jgi:hypothetical protein